MQIIVMKMTDIMFCTHNKTDKIEDNIQNSNNICFDFVLLQIVLQILFVANTFLIFYCKYFCRRETLVMKSQHKCAWFGLPL